MNRGFLNTAASASSARRIALWLLAGVVAAAQAEQLLEPRSASLTLRSRALVTSPAFTLGDILIFDEADDATRAELAALPALTEPAGAPAVDVTHAQVSERLTALGVNMSRVLLGGAAACRVEILPSAAPAEPDSTPQLETGAPTPRRSSAMTDAPRTLADLLRERIARDLNALGGAPDVEFETAARDFLELREPPFEFSIHGPRDARLGLREYQVTIRRDGRTQRTVRISAQVRLLRKVAVAAKPLNVGTTLRLEHLAIRERLFEDAAPPELGDPGALVGQQVQRYLNAGDLLTPDALEPRDLVLRSRPVTVIGGGAVQINVSGIALDTGRLGDSVRVRLGDGRQRREIRGTVSGVGTVRIES